MFAWTKKVSRPPPKERTTNVTFQESCLLEEDAQPTEDSRKLLIWKVWLNK